jgi:membrane glycosyltransferase
LFLLLGALQAGLDHLHEKFGMFPAASAAVLFLMTLALLFGPKVLSLLHLFSRPKELAAFGGPARVLLGAILEMLFSILTAPVLVWFHTRFVLWNIAGKTVTWHTQTRGGGGPSWFDVVWEYWPLTLAGVGLGAAAWWIAPSYLAWISPILLGLLLAIPIAKFGGGTGLLRKLFLTPEELLPPKELCVRSHLQLRDGDQFVHALLDPFYNAVHAALQRPRESSTPALDGYVASLAARLFKEGQDALTPQQKRALLGDGQTLANLHDLIWKTPAARLHPSWAKALAQYRSSKRGARPQPASVPVPVVGASGR